MVRLNTGVGDMREFEAYSYTCFAEILRQGMTKGLEIALPAKRRRIVR